MSWTKNTCNVSIVSYVEICREIIGFVRGSRSSFVFGKFSGTFVYLFQTIPMWETQTFPLTLIMEIFEKLPTI